MSKFETIVPAGAEAARLTEAFYRFLETRILSVGDEAAIHTEVLPHGERRTVTLWSDQAVADFKAFLHDWVATAA
ncbi:MAG: hypothetical protein JO303_18035 [Caulobacteraceae bacterium]|nr:hypothetical protein [Caulobacteraceae bacterium]